MDGGRKQEHFFLSGEAADTDRKIRAIYVQVPSDLSPAMARLLCSHYAVLVADHFGWSLLYGSAAIQNNPYCLALVSPHKVLIHQQVGTATHGGLLFVGVEDKGFRLVHTHGRQHDLS